MVERRTNDFMASDSKTTAAAAKKLGARPLFHCQLCEGPAVLATMRDIEVSLDPKTKVCVAVGFRLPGQSSEAPALCPACQASLLQLAAETAEAALEKKA